MEGSVKSKIRALIHAGFSPDSPAAEAMSNQWIMRDFVELLKKSMEIPLIVSVRQSHYDRETGMHKRWCDLCLLCITEHDKEKLTCFYDTLNIPPDFPTNICKIIHSGTKAFVFGRRRAFSVDIETCEIQMLQDRSPEKPDLCNEYYCHILGDSILFEYLYDNEMEVFSMKEGKWLEDIEIPPEYRDREYIAIVSGKIYVFGKENAPPPLSDNTAWEFVSRTSRDPPFKKASTVVIQDRYVLFMGGISGRDPDDGTDNYVYSVDVYDTVCQKWSHHSDALICPLSEKTIVTTATGELVSITHYGGDYITSIQITDPTTMKSAFYHVPALPSGMRLL